MIYVDYMFTGALKVIELPLGTQQGVVVRDNRFSELISQRVGFSVVQRGQGRPKKLVQEID